MQPLSTIQNFFDTGVLKEPCETFGSESRLMVGPRADLSHVGILTENLQFAYHCQCIVWCIEEKK